MKKTFTILLTLIASISLFSCMTMKEIPDDKTSAQILQMGQNAAAANSFKNAEFCFNTVIERFGQDPYILVQSKYELAHIYMKQKKYSQAKLVFNEILNLHNLYPGTIPPKYKKLSNMGLAEIEEKTAPKGKKSKKGKN